MKYWPNNFVIGFYRHAVLSDNNQDLTHLKFGIPSCKWMKNEKFTDLSRFSKLTGGFLPHVQRDSEKQLMKDLTSATEVIDNRSPISGFKLVDTWFDKGIHLKKVLVEDPRGFVIELPINWLNSILFIPGMRRTILESGEIVGKWFYLWEDKSYTLAPAEAAISVEFTDEVLASIESKKSKLVSSSALKPGTVYDIADGVDGLSAISRYVYLGKFAVHSPSLVEKCITTTWNVVRTLHSVLKYKHSTDWRMLFEYASKNNSSDKNWYLPWGRSDAKTVMHTLLRNEKKNQPIFIKLSDNYFETNSNWFGHSNALYCDDLAGVPIEKKEHSIVFSFIAPVFRKTYGFNSSIQLKNIVSESSDQTVKVDDKTILNSRLTASDNFFRYKDPSEFKTLDFESLKNGFAKYLEKVDEILERCKSLSPLECPTDDLALENWARLVVSSKT